MAESVRALIRQFLRFGAVGIMGFVVDAGVLVLLLHTTQAGLYLSRVVSFLCAATLTWWLNRTITFRSQAAARKLPTEWLSFVAANSLGGVVNFGVYSAVVWHFARSSLAPIGGVAAGSLAGLLVNFWLSRAYVFRGNTA